MAKNQGEPATENAVTHMGVTVKVYKCGAETGRPFHKFSYFLNGKLKPALRRGLSDAQAHEEALKIAETLAGKDRDVLELTADDVNAYRQAAGPGGR